jgi:hypothetical protein
VLYDSGMCWRQGLAEEREECDCHLAPCSSSFGEPSYRYRVYMMCAVDEIPVKTCRTHRMGTCQCHFSSTSCLGDVKGWVGDVL